MTSPFAPQSSPHGNPVQRAQCSRAASTGLVLTGGGARAAYQVGVLKAVAKIRRECIGRGPNPFGIITGTSAGAINAAALACNADEFDAAVSGLVRVWKHLHAARVYQPGGLGLIATGAHFLWMMALSWMFPQYQCHGPRALLDNTPLHALLQELIPVQRLPDVMRQGHLQGLAVTASSYGSGLHVTFYDAVRPITTSPRSQHMAVQAPITIQHLLASSAIPFVFPAVPLAVEGRNEFFGDGSMRQSAPIAPAVHLGSERILVIGAARMHEPVQREGRQGSEEYPSLAQIAGHALSNIFLDSLAVDIARLERINHTLSLLEPQAWQKTTLRPIDVLVIAPSLRLDDIAARHLYSMPGSMRALLRGVGVSGEAGGAHGAALASYVLFEASYTQELLALGEADTLARRDEVVQFFGWAAGNDSA